MNFQCKNCGGNMVFSPADQKMLCPYCDGLDCEEKKGDDSITVCASCAGEITIDQFTSSSKCPYCGNYIVFDKRVSGKYEPKMIIPFKISKEEAVSAMDKEFSRRIFAPSSFLSEKSLVGMNGFYVPFFMYDYHTEGHYQGTGTKVRTWRSGDYDYTETSFYDIKREFVAEYDNVPADASYGMDDATMDLMEPFDYATLCSFDPKYLSGFFGEIYNDEPEVFEPRARQKVENSARGILQNSISGYSSVKPVTNMINSVKRREDFALLPVWLYIYSYGGKTYRYYVNGQNGKVVGITPVSKKKVMAYGFTFALLIGAVAEIIISLVGGLLS